MVLREAPTSSAYVDDTMVHSQSFREHISHLQNTLELYPHAKMQNPSSVKQTIIGTLLMSFLKWLLLCMISRKGMPHGDGGCPRKEFSAFTCSVNFKFGMPCVPSMG